MLWKLLIIVCMPAHLHRQRVRRNKGRLDVNYARMALPQKTVPVGWAHATQKAQPGRGGAP